MLEKTNAAVVFGRRELGGSHRRMRPVSFSAHLRGRLMSTSVAINSSSYGTAQPFSTAGGSHIEAPPHQAMKACASATIAGGSRRGEPIVMWKSDWPNFIGARAHSVNDVEES